MLHRSSTADKTLEQMLEEGRAREEGEEARGVACSKAGIEPGVVA